MGKLTLNRYYNMEVKGGKDRKMVVCLYELIGTCLLLLAVNWGGPAADRVAIMLFCIIMLIGRVTGAHVNPAVTMGVLITQAGSEEENFGKNLPFALLIWAAQCIGAVLGCLLSRTGAHNGTGGWIGGFGTLCPKNFYHNGNCNAGDGTFSFFMMEMVGTFIFVSVILSAKRMNGATCDGGDIINAGTVATALYGVLCMIGGFTGGCVNPAVGLAQSFYQNFARSVPLSSLWVYIAAPMAGGALAGLFAMLRKKIFVDAQAKASSSVSICEGGK